MNVLPFTLSDLLARLHSRQPFSFSRYGDGEWMSILDAPGPQADRHQFFPRMRDDLCRSICEPRAGTIFAMQPLAMQRLGAKIEKWLWNHKVSLEWFYADTLHDANLAGCIRLFADAVAGGILVGPGRLARLPIDWEAHIQIPGRDCYLEKTAILKTLRALSLKGKVVCFSASMLANVLIHELEGSGATLLDCGSIWEPHVGVASRGYHRNMPEEAILRAQ